MKSTHVRNHTSSSDPFWYITHSSIKHSSSEQVEKIIESHGQNEPARRRLELRHHHHRASICKLLFLLRNLFKLMECLLHYTFFSYSHLAETWCIAHHARLSSAGKEESESYSHIRWLYQKNEASSAQRLSTHELIIVNLPELARMPNSIRILKSISKTRLAFIVCRTFANANKFTLTAVKFTISREIFFLVYFITQQQR